MYDPGKVYANRRQNIPLYKKQMNNIHQKDSSVKLAGNCKYHRY